MDIRGRNALVTGGATRVGRAITMALAGAGANVYIHYNSSEGPAVETAAEVTAAGRTAVHGAANLSDPESTAGLMRDASERLGPISILINSASGFPTDTLEDATLDGLRVAHDLTLMSPVMLTKAFVAALPDGVDGCVVNVTDVRTTRPYRDHFSYILAKGGLDTFTRAAAVQLGPRVRVNAVALGIILPPPGEGEDYAQRIAARIPMGRPGGTEPVASAIVHLVENDFVTGEIVRIDGGGHLLP